VNANEPVEVYASTTLTDAEIVKNYLEGEGITCELEGENQAALSGLLTVRVLVRAWDEERARRVLASHVHLSAVGPAERARH
jgi:Putative prokaryotic signal transducing protein